MTIFILGSIEREKDSNFPYKAMLVDYTNQYIGYFQCESDGHKFCEKYLAMKKVLSDMNNAHRLGILDNDMYKDGLRTQWLPLVDMFINE